MAGKDTTGGFDSTFFRDQIHSVMQMGLPNASQDQVTFRWTSTHTYSQQDTSDHPYNWGATPVTTTSHADVSVPVVVQFQETNIQGDAIGVFDPSRAILTLLDVDYVKVAGADLVLIGDRTFTIDVVAPPQGLFDVDIYTVYATQRGAN